MSKIVAIIPARSGSKGVPNKNIRMLGGHPLIEWSIKACLKSDFIDRVLVSTDSLEYAQLSIGCGAEAPFIRPAEISSDHSTDYDFIAHALNWLASNNEEPEFLVHIRPTTPYRSSKLVDEAIELFRSQPKATALRSVHEMSESAYKTFEISQLGNLIRLCSHNSELDLVNNARQEFPSTYQANGYVDVLSCKFISDNKLIHGDHVIPFITPVATELDTENDFKYLEFLLKQSPSIADEIFSKD